MLFALDVHQDGPGTFDMCPEIMDALSKTRRLHTRAGTLQGLSQRSANKLTRADASRFGGGFKLSSQLIVDFEIGFHPIFGISNSLQMSRETNPGHPFQLAL